MQLSLTPVVKEAAESAEGLRQAQSTILRTLDRFQPYFADQPELRAELDSLRTALQSAPQEAIERLAKWGPSPKPGNIAFSVERLYNDLSPEKRAEAAVILALHNRFLDRSRASTWEMLDAEARRIFEVDSPEAWMKAKAAGKIPRKEVDVVAYKQLVGLFDSEVEQGYVDVRAAAGMPEGAAKADAIKSASDRLAQAQIKKIEALHGLANTGTFFGRGLSTMRYLANPLTPGETFRGRVIGGLKRAGVKKDVAERFWSEYEQEAAKGALADRSAIEDAFTKILQPRFSDKVVEFWKAGLLGWPTQVANTASNVMFFGLRNLEEGITSLVKGGPTSARYEMLGRWMGAKRALAELRDDPTMSLSGALKDALLARKPNTYDILERGSRFDEGSPVPQLGAIEGRFGEFVRTPFKLLNIGDNAGKHISRMQLYGQEAMRIAQDPAKRRDGEAVLMAGARIFNEMVTAARSPVGNAKKFAEYKAFFTRANREMNRDLFQAPVGPVGRTLQGLAQRRTEKGGLTAEALVTNALAPFIKTPANVLKEALYRTPLGFAKTLMDVRSGKLPLDEATGEYVKAALGTTIMLSTLGAALEGSITGGGPTDVKQQELLKESGWQPYSFRIPGGAYISYQRLEPLATVLGIAADAAEGIKRGEFSNWQDSVKRMAGAVTENLTNKTFLTGLEGAVSALNDPFRNMPRFIKQLEASAVPNILGTVPIGGLARAIDPNFRQTEVGLSPLVAKIPGLSTTLPPQRTPLGEERKRPGGWLQRLVSPLVTSEEKAGPVADVARELDRIGYAPQAIPPYVTLNGQRVYYTREEQEAMAKAERRGVEALAQVIARPDFQGLPDKDSIATEGQTTKEDVVRRVLRAYKTPYVQLANRRALARARRGEFRPGARA